MVSALTGGQNVTITEYLEATGDSQREFARRAGIHEGRFSLLKRPGGFPASLEQALDIMRASNGLVTPNDFLPPGKRPKRAARLRKSLARPRKD